MQEIKRDTYLQELIDRKENSMIKVITGIRRSGKSYLLFNLYYNYLLSIGVKKENIITIALDDEKNKKLKEADALYRFIHSKIKDKSEMYYVFIDEVQYAIKKEDLKSDEPLSLYGVLNGLLHLRNVDVYVTGSNSKLLSKDVLTEFRGRGDEVRVYPLTFKEYYDYMGGDKLEAFEDYYIYGGLPFVLSFNNPKDKMRYLSKLFNEVYFKDIIERYDLKFIEIMSLITDDLCSSIGSLTNSSKIAKTLKSVKKINVDSETIAKYLECLKESFLFSEAKRYDVKGKKYFSYPSKYYAIDLGLRNARINFRQKELTHIMENIIYNELIARGYYVDVGVVEVSVKGKRKSVEIDFIANMGPERYYIQSAYNIYDEDKKNMELRPLMATKDFFRKIVINGMWGRKTYDDNGIVYMGLIDFLLDKNSLKS